MALVNTNKPRRFVVYLGGKVFCSVTSFNGT